MWADDPLWERFWSVVPGSRWAPLGEADGPYRGRLGWSAATLGAAVTNVGHAPSVETFTLCAIALGALVGVLSVDQRNHHESRESNG